MNDKKIEEFINSDQFKEFKKYFEGIVKAIKELWEIFKKAMKPFVEFNLKIKEKQKNKLNQKWKYKDAFNQIKGISQHKRLPKMYLNYRGER